MTFILIILIYCIREDEKPIQGLSLYLLIRVKIFSYWVFLSLIDFRHVDDKGGLKNSEFLHIWGSKWLKDLHLSGFSHTCSGILIWNTRTHLDRLRDTLQWTNQSLIITSTRGWKADLRGRPAIWFLKCRSFTTRNFSTTNLKLLLRLTRELSLTRG